MLRRWYDRWIPSQDRSFRRDRAGTRQARRRTLHLESLEDRTLPSFAAPTAFDLGAPPAGVAVGHFEGASAPLDLVTANANGTVSVLLGKGDGTVQNPILLTVGGSPSGVAVGDFLGNGLDDIAVASSNGSVNVILSNGNGTFQAPETLSLGADPAGIVVGDFTGDGKLDIVTANTNGTVTVLPGRGDGTFGTVATSTIGGNLTSVAAGDFNGDHKLDLVVGTSTGLDTLLGRGDGTFQLKQTVSFTRTIDGIPFTFAVNSVAVSSLRSNGKEDVVALSREGLAVLLGKGDGTLQNPAFLNTFASSFVVGDFNRDSKPDIVVSGGEQDVTPASLEFLAGKGDGTFAVPKAFNLGEAATSLAAGDFRGDGKLDLVLATQSNGNTVTVLSGNGDGSFALAPSFGSNGLSTGIAVGDFNGDGKPDLVTSGASLSILLNNGDGTFRQGQSIALNGFGGPVVVGDFNGDGKQDIAVALGDTIDIFLGNGNGTFQAPKVINLGTNELIESMVVGNFVHNGRPDLAVSVVFETGSVPAAVQILDNRGGGNFVKGQTINFSSETNGLATGDFRGDGNVDLVTDTFNSAGTRSVNVLLGNGNGTFRTPIVTSLGLSPNIVATGDFNGDGKSDLVLVDYFQGDNSVLVLQGNGDSSFGRPLVFKFDIPLTFAQPVGGDFFGDGHLSFALTTGSGNVTVVRGNGDGTFQAPINYVIANNGSQPSGLVAADFNGDGKLDLAATGFASQDVSVLFNTSPRPTSGAVSTSTTLTVDNTSAVTGQEVTLTATVSASSGAATGSVIFFDGSQILGIVALDPNGQARLRVSFLAGIHELHASFVGIEPFTASASATLAETVNKAATTTTLSVDDVFGDFVILSAAVLPNAPGSGTPTGTLTFYDGSRVLGTVSSSGGGTLAVRLAVGTHRLKVVYSGDSDFLGSTSNIVVLTL